jgi:hypothetical protein
MTALPLKLKASGSSGPKSMPVWKNRVCVCVCVCARVGGGGRKRLAGGEPVEVLVTCAGQCLGVIAQRVVQLNHMEVGTSANTGPLTQHHIPDGCVSSAHESDCCSMGVEVLPNPK